MNSAEVPFIKGTNLPSPPFVKGDLGGFLIRGKII
jgi:hypothetical protein